MSIISDNTEEQLNKKLNIVGYTLISFIDNDIREILKDELSSITITSDKISTSFIDKLTDNILIKLNNETNLIHNFLENKKEYIKETKKNIKDIKKKISKNELVKIAKTQKKIITSPPLIDSSIVDYSNNEYLTKLKLTDLKTILKELSKNRTNINQYGKKTEIIQRIIDLNNSSKTQQDDDDEQNDDEQNDDEQNDDEHDDEQNDDEHDDNDEHDDDEPKQQSKKQSIKEKKILDIQIPKKVTKKY